MGFRYKGTNWEGRHWAASLAIEALGREIEAAILDRPTRSDGTVASKNHDASSPRSDHRPTPHTGPGTVRAIDITVTPEQGRELAEHLVESRDPRVRYIIHAGRIASSYATSKRDAWKWGRYTGHNAHTTHVHVSTLPHADQNKGTWGLANVTFTGEGETVDYLKIDDMQKALNEAGRTDYEGKFLKADGKYGQRTHSALVKGFQFVDVGDAIGTNTSLERLREEFNRLKNVLRGV